MRHIGLITTLLAALLTGALLACGGGGGGGGGSPPRNVVDIEPAGMVSGALTTGDEVLAEDGTRLDFYRVTLPQAGQFTARLESTDFDAYLFLFEGAALDHAVLDEWEPYFLADDDDSGGGTDAEITIPLPAGTYVVVVNSFFPAFGDYTLITAFLAFSPSATEPLQLMSR
ncbi:MAG: hypothetical protein ACNA8S_15700 [Deferrisomatales bacterium]